jgi:hypothetical protein
MPRPRRDRVDQIAQQINGVAARRKADHGQQPLESIATALDIARTVKRHVLIVDGGFECRPSWIKQALRTGESGVVDKPF